MEPLYAVGATELSPLDIKHYYPICFCVLKLRFSPSTRGVLKRSRQRRGCAYPTSPITHHRIQLCAPFLTYSTPSAPRAGPGRRVCAFVRIMFQFPGLKPFPRMIRRPLSIYRTALERSHCNLVQRASKAKNRGIWLSQARSLKRRER